MSFSILYSAITRGKWFIDFREVDAHQMLIHSFLERDIEMENKSKLSEREPIPFLMNSGAEVFYGTDYLQAPANSTAIIPLHGSMLKYGTYCSYGTTEIADMIDMAVESPKISGLILDIDSGGGSVDAIAPLVCSIQNARKKQKCVIAYADLCASAAYYVACYCNEIIASNNISSEFGSIGVMMSFMDYEKYYESNGVKQHTIYSDLSNYKNEPFELARKGEYEKMGKFNFIETEIPGVVVIEPTVFGDDRGYFMETYQIDDFAAAGIDKPFVQDNQSRSTKGVLRGLHFQKNHTQGKLVRVTMGEVYDVAVDCRPNSKTFGKWVGVTLSAENKKMFYIPEGFAHGFLVLSDVAEFCYKCTDVYDPTAEGGIPYDDPTVNVQWPDCGCEHKTSAKDKEHTPFAKQKFEYFEKY